MPKIDLRIGSTSIAEASFEVQNCYGQGAPDYPRLGFVLDLAIRPYRRFHAQNKWTDSPVSALVLTGYLLGASQNKISSFFQEIGVEVRDASYQHVRQVNLEIPLDQFKLSRMEESRTGNLQGALKFRMLVALHEPNGQIGFDIAESGELGFAIPKSDWVEKILPTLGYGKLELLEIRIPEAVKPRGLPLTVEELKRAKKYLDQGEWDKAVAHCRNAIEAIPRSRKLAGRPQHVPDKLEAFVAQHIKEKIGESLAVLLLEHLKSVYRVTNIAHHPSQAGHFRRADAEFIVRSAMTLAEYVGKILE
ncbi:MAG: hypothetical protein L0338_21685 [Acidobacteria bacterium]|nr:hypothetical protein [Acidobacteriota bacterium]